MKKLTVIRWLKAFGGYEFSIADIVKYETTTTDELSAEVVPFWGKTNIHAKVGLLVDTSKTELVVCYPFDAYTVRRSDGTHYALRYNGNSKPVMYVPKWFDNRTRVAKTWQKVKKLLPLIEKGFNQGFHSEVMIKNPVYKAVVVKRNTSASDRQFARKIAEKLGVNVIYDW